MEVAVEVSRGGVGMVRATGFAWLENDIRTCVLWKWAKSVGRKKVSPGLDAMNGSVTCSAMHLLHMSAKAGGREAARRAT